MLGFFCEAFAKNPGKNSAAKYGTPRPPSGKIFKKAASPELACVYELQKTGATLARKIFFREIINTNDECFKIIAKKLDDLMKALLWPRKNTIDKKR